MGGRGCATDKVRSLEKEPFPTAGHQNVLPDELAFPAWDSCKRFVAEEGPGNVEAGLPSGNMGNRQQGERQGRQQETGNGRQEA